MRNMDYSKKNQKGKEMKSDRLKSNRYVKIASIAYKNVYRLSLL